MRNPGERSYAVALVAENAFGIGRSCVGIILDPAIQVHGSKADFAQLFGRGALADKTYNDWVSQCQFLIVKEAKDVSWEDFY